MMSNIPCEAAVDTVSLNTVIKLYNGLHRAVKKQRGSSGPCGHPPSSLDHSHHLLSFCPAIIRMSKLTHASLPINSLCLPRSFCANMHSVDLCMDLISLVQGLLCNVCSEWP